MATADPLHHPARRPGDAPKHTAGPSKAQISALTRAAGREGGNICPMRTRGNAQTVLLNALDDRGFVTWDGSVPCISDAGRAAIAKATGADQ